MNAGSKGRTLKLADLRKLATQRIAGGHKSISIVVSDIEGCLNLNERTYDHKALAWIRLANELARHDNAIPFITVCSGRQHAFVEAIVRMIGGRIPAIFESGCGLYFPGRDLYHEYEWHPLLRESRVLSESARVRQVVADVCERTGARRVIGKEVLVSLHPAPPMSVSDLHRVVNALLAEREVSASVSCSASAVDVAPVGIDKAAGVEWLLEELRKELPVGMANVAGIGDSEGDIPFLRIVGWPAAPANAQGEVRAIAKYASRAVDGKGVVDIIERCIEMNLAQR